MASDKPRLLFRQGFNGCVTSDLYEAAVAGKGTDMKFEIGSTGTLFNAHTAVIRSQSKVLDVMLNETWTPASPKQQKEEITLKLPDDPEEFKMFLKFLYGNQELNDINFDVTIPVWKLADKYGADNVLALFVDYFQFLKLNFDKVDVARLLPIAHKHRCEYLVDVAMKHVKSNLHLYWTQERTDWLAWPVDIVTDILSTDSIKLANFSRWQLNESWITFHAHKWLTNYTREKKLSKDQKYAVATQVFQNIRYCQLDHDQFKFCLKTKLYGMLQDKQIAIITFVHCGVTDENILKSHGPDLAFKVDRRLRHEEPKSNQ